MIEILFLLTIPALFGILLILGWAFDFFERYIARKEREDLLKNYLIDVETIHKIEQFNRTEYVK